MTIWFRPDVCRSLACLTSTSLSMTALGRHHPADPSSGTIDFEKVPQ